MRLNNDKVEELIIAYIGGGSRNWAWSLMSDLALEEQLSGVVRLFDIDFDAACENRDFGNKVSSMGRSRGKWKYEAVENIEDTLRGADFVVISILPGTFEEMRSDVHLPEKYGIYQSVGDTTGPAGLMRALRTIPIYAGFAEKIREYTPNAWVINYTNPMALCTRALYAVFPQINAFGCCHGVFEGQELLVHALKDVCGIEGVARNDIRTNVLGINHFTWIDRASYKTMDLFPTYREFVNKYWEEGYEPKGKDSWKDNVFESANRVTMDLFKTYGTMAFSGDRHLAEFIPPCYLKNPETVKSWKFHITPVDFRIKLAKERDIYRKKVISGEEQLLIMPSGEEGVLQIIAILGLGEIITNVNMPNKGQMPGIPDGSIVETNALFSRNNVQPVFAGRLPIQIHNLVNRHVLNQETILKAALSRDKELAFKAFINDPLITISQKDARKLFEQMIRNTRNYLPGWNVDFN